MSDNGDFEPKIVQFCCNWCSYTGADLAGSCRLQYPTNTRVVRVMCTGMIHPNMVIDALTKGTDGVLVCGCHIGDCHYIDGNERMKSRAATIEMLLEDFGIEPERFRLEWVSASEAQRFVEVVNNFVKDIKELGPNPFA